jgi:hypothetical protein
MSKLRNRIRDLGRRRPMPFGFAPARSEAPSARQLLVIAEVTDATDAAQAVTAGADALVYGGGADSLESVVAAAGTLPVGARLDAATTAGAAAARKAGADFLVFADDASAAGAIRDPELGYVVLASGLTDDGLRLLRILDLDGVMIAPPTATMTVRQQLQTRRLSDLARKPLFARLEAGSTTPDADVLESWRDAGVAVVVAPAAAIAALTAAAAAIPAPREPQGRREATVPAMRPSSLDDEEEV